MRVLVIGAGRVGANVIRELQKNPAIDITIADPRPTHFAVDEGLIDKVDIQENITPLTIERILDEARPDLVLITMQPEDMGLGKSPGVEVLAEALHEQVAALSPVPVIAEARTI